MSVETVTIALGDSYTFTDPGGADTNYGDNEDNIYLFEVPEGAIISITGSYTIEFGYDSLSFYDGDNSGSVMIFNTAQADTDTNTGSISIRTTGKYLYVQFNSDHSVNDSGWNLTLTAENPNKIAIALGDSYTFTDSGGADTNYGDNEDNIYLFEVPEGAIINITGSYTIEFGYDSLSFYDGDNSDSVMIFNTAQTDTNTGSISIRTTGKYLYVQFNSDHSVNDSGWNLTLTAENPNNTIAIALGDSYTFTDSGGADTNYGDNEDNIYLFEVPEGAIISITGSYTIEHGWDSLSFYDGDNSGSVMIFNTADQPTDTGSISIQTNGRYLYVQFKSDVDVNYSGWNLTLTPKIAIALGDSYTFTDSGGADTNYGDNEDNIYLFEVPEGAIISITGSYTIEHGWDSLSFYDGDNSSSVMIFNTADQPTDADTGSISIQTNGRYLYVQFKSDVDVNDSGWNLTLTPKIAIALGDSYTFTDSGGAHTNYGDNEDNIYLFEVPEGAIISITGSYAIEFGFDSLSFYDGDNSNSVMIFNTVDQPTDTDTGSISIQTTGRYLYVQFNSDGSVRESGWNLILIADSEPGAVPICFPGGTPVTTDQGFFPIEKLNPDIHTIKGKKIIAITQTRPLFKEIVSIQKNALAKNVPSQDTEISNNHTVFYKGNMTKADELVELCEGVKFIPYNGETLYNVLLKKHSVMTINNMVCETLDPNNIMAKICGGDFNTNEKRNLINKVSVIYKNNDVSGYYKLRSIVEGINQYRVSQK